MVSLAYDSAAMMRRGEQALRLPLGMASPMWLAFGLAASAAVSWWWMNRWARTGVLAAPTAPARRPVMLSLVPKVPAPAARDDLTRLVGIGPKLAAALAERGVTAFAQIAAWTEADLAEIDAALNLRGRASRDDWVGQAKRFAAGG
jgi:predicted flap endonuclease-1-like 5' DNA nuclease